MELLIELDKKLLLFLNSLNSPLWDDIMFSISGKYFWIPFYLLIIGFIIKDKKKEAILYIICILIGFAFTETVASSIFKPMVMRFRPSHDPEIGHLVHIVNNYRGGTYGYFSAHASNTFGLAFILFFTYQKKFKWMYLIIIWASVVSYSRIYLGVHYPLDILSGMICGMISGKVMTLSYLKISEKIHKKRDLA